ncbi:MAG TPA: hypothetical protein VLG50_08100 [Candidatus Saccharimonadales bacterium]|nr:hypothetical protein [Candidatus Saccharimonadales bacterium]
MDDCLGVILKWIPLKKLLTWRCVSTSMNRCIEKTIKTMSVRELRKPLRTIIRRKDVRLLTLLNHLIKPDYFLFRFACANHRNDKIIQLMIETHVNLLWIAHVIRTLDHLHYKLLFTLLRYDVDLFIKVVGQVVGRLSTPKHIIVLHYGSGFVVGQDCYMTFLNPVPKRTPHEFKLLMDNI